MDFYKEMQNIANNVLKEFKQGDVKLIHYTKGEGGTPDEPADLIEKVYNLDATVTGVNYKYLINNYAVASDLTVTAGVIEGVKISIDDFIEVQGVRHKIIRDISPAPSSVNGNPVVWRFICRKG